MIGVSDLGVNERLRLSQVRLAVAANLSCVFCGIFRTRLSCRMFATEHLLEEEADKYLSAGTQSGWADGGLCWRLH